MDRQDPSLLQTAALLLARKGRRAWPLTVTAKTQLGPRMLRVSFFGADLDELEYKRGQDVVLELPRADGSLSRRHYTVGHHDAKTMDIDFVMHGEGASGEWLDALRQGDEVIAVGPRGHTYVRDADWHLFSGDETCIPGIFAMLEGLAASDRAFVFIEVDSEADILPHQSKADVKMTWLFRRGRRAGPNDIMLKAMQAFEIPQGYGFAYIIGETSNVRAVRHHLLERGMPKDRIAAEGYWRPGRIGGHDHV
ncbi:MAG: siderophore-interacting protein [Rhizomicrobium sp.]